MYLLKFLKNFNITSKRTILFQRHEVSQEVPIILTLNTYFQATLNASLRKHNEMKKPCLKKTFAYAIRIFFGCHRKSIEINLDGALGTSSTCCLLL